MHVMTAMQLVGQAPEGMQIKNAKLAGIFDIGRGGSRELCLGAGACEVTDLNALRFER